MGIKTILKSVFKGLHSQNGGVVFLEVYKSKKCDKNNTLCIKAYL